MTEEEVTVEVEIDTSRYTSALWRPAPVVDLDWIMRDMQEGLARRRFAQEALRFAATQPIERDLEVRGLVESVHTGQVALDEARAALQAMREHSIDASLRAMMEAIAAVTPSWQQVADALADIGKTVLEAVKPAVQGIVEFVASLTAPPPGVDPDLYRRYLDARAAEADAPGKRTRLARVRLQRQVLRQDRQERREAQRRAQGTVQR